MQCACRERRDAVKARVAHGPRAARRRLAPRVNRRSSFGSGPRCAEAACCNVQPGAQASAGAWPREPCRLCLRWRWRADARFKGPATALAQRWGWLGSVVVRPPRSARIPRLVPRGPRDIDVLGSGGAGHAALEALEAGLGAASARNKATAPSARRAACTDSRAAPGRAALSRSAERARRIVRST